MDGRHMDAATIDCPGQNGKCHPVAMICQNPSLGISPLWGSAITGDKLTLQKHLPGFLGAINMRDHFGRTLLIYAVLGDKPECVEIILKAGANINIADGSGRTALHWAAYKNSYRCLKLLLSKGANRGLQDGEGATALHIASQHISAKCLALILKYLGQEEIDVQDNDKRTALHWSACCGHLENVKLLVKYRSNCGNPDVEGKTPIHWAASSCGPDATECVKVLLESAPMVINWTDYEGRGALHLAVADGTEAVVRELVSSKYCDVNLTDNTSRTPLHLAALLGLPNIVNVLLENDAKCSIPDASKATPLHYASLSNSVATVNALLEHCLDVDSSDKDGCSPLMWAAGKGASDVMIALLSHNANICATDKHGATALHIAALSGHTTAINILLDNGALISALDVMGRSALSHVCEMGHVAALHTLLDAADATVNIADNEGRLALHWACIGGHKEICQILMQYYCNPDVKDFQGRTPLMYATFGGYLDCMSVLIEHRASPHHSDNEGFTSLHWACKQGHIDAVQLLMTCNVNPNCLSRINRYTPLDLALLGDYFDVAHLVVSCGGLSVIHIANEAATKIQAFYRGYRARKYWKLMRKKEREQVLAFADCWTNSSKMLSLGHDLRTTNVAENQMSSRENLNDSVFLKNENPLQVTNADEKSEASSTKETFLNTSDPSALLTSSCDEDDSDDMFLHLKQDNAVKAIRMNRKTFQNTCTSSIPDKMPSSTSKYTKSNCFSKFTKQEKRSTSLSKDKIGSSVSLFSLSKLSNQNSQSVGKEYPVHHHSLLHLSDCTRSKKRLFTPFRKKTREDDVLQQCVDTNLPDISSDPLKDTYSSELFCERPTPVDEINSTLQLHFSMSCVKPKNSSKSLGEIDIKKFQNPTWCLDPTLRKFAEEEWLISLFESTLERVPLTQLLSNKSRKTLRS